MQYFPVLSGVAWGVFGCGSSGRSSSTPPPAPPPVITSFDVTGAGTAAGQGTTAIDINDASGAITGNYTDANGVNHGFLRAPDGTITKFDAPGASTTRVGTVPQSISSGAIAGV